MCPHLLVLAVVIRDHHFFQALAPRIHAIFVVLALASTPELFLGGSNTGAKHRAVDELEVRRYDSSVLRLVDNGYRQGLVGGKGADLAPVAAGKLVGEDLLVFFGPRLAQLD
jgi:hypothetical protein